MNQVDSKIDFKTSLEILGHFLNTVNIFLYIFNIWKISRALIGREVWSMKPVPGLSYNRDVMQLSHSLHITIIHPMRFCSYGERSVSRPKRPGSRSRPRLRI